MKRLYVALTAGMIACPFIGATLAMEPARFHEKVVHAFGGTDGAAPEAPVINVKGTLYGTTSEGGNGMGTLYSFNPQTNQESVLFTFLDGAWGQLIYVKGTLYGVTAGGGDIDEGAAYSFDLKSNEEKYIYVFCSQANCVDGAFPSAGLLDVGGTLYGTTAAGGSSNLQICDSQCGTVFSLDPKSSTEKVLHSFCTQQNCPDGSSPTAELVKVDGLLYGTTQEGGKAGCSNRFGCGTVFSVNPVTGEEKTLYVFCSQQGCADGASPYAGLVEVKGKLYGTTEGGGTPGCGGNGCGTVFSIDPNSGIENVVYSFRGGTDGANPVAALLGVKDTMYGTTQAGGGSCVDPAGCGTVFTINLKSGAENVLYAFQGGSDGAYPTRSLIDVDGTIYGTTLNGGRVGCGGQGCGTLFSLTR